MATQHGLHGFHVGGRFHLRARPGAMKADVAAKVTSAVGVREAAIAALRVGVGFAFFWAFLDKTFGLGYSTPSARAWIHGGSPTKGFLASVNVGPWQSMYHAWAGKQWADWLFMLGLLGIGLALILGIGLRFAAVAGTILVAMMWFAVFPPAKHAADGSASGSVNPFVDEHVMDALALFTIAAFGTGSRLGLGAMWAKLPFVRRHRALL
ncbi:MAG TPA: DoxX family membrane protein, partial [Actinocrinis sp.]|uniref:DoxX family membrane protein n=1 Tax=Actinocrinis sp. TaxID=1920516 RepID=UPI002D33CD17